MLAVGAGIAAGEPGAGGAQANLAAAQTDSSISQAAREAVRERPRTLATTRSLNRVPLKNRTGAEPVDRLWTTEDLDLRVAPVEKAKTDGLLDSGKRVEVTGKYQGAFAEVVLDDASRWVTAKYLSRKKPAPEPDPASPAAAVSGAPCPDGSSIESALQPGAVKVYRAVCAAFPELTTYGGQDGHGEHVNGEAIDFMVPSSSVGERVKDFLYAHRAEFGLFDIIWAQHIWTIERAGEGFRPMSDRGSATANHYDHVHIKIN